MHTTVTNSKCWLCLMYYIYTSCGRWGEQHCCGHPGMVTCQWCKSWWMSTKWMCFRRTRYVLTHAHSTVYTTLCPKDYCTVHGYMQISTCTCICWFFRHTLFVVLTHHTFVIKHNNKDANRSQYEMKFLHCNVWTQSSQCSVSLT